MSILTDERFLYSLMIIAIARVSSAAAMVITNMMITWPNAPARVVTVAAKNTASDSDTRRFPYSTVCIENLAYQNAEVPSSCQALADLVTPC